MTKVTYLIGAGASANALPVVSNIPERIKRVIEVLKDNKQNFSEIATFAYPNSATKRECLHLLIEDLEWLHEAASNHATVDTFAKKLYLLGNKFDDLRRLQNILSTYFTLEQEVLPKENCQKCTEGKVDSRYDAFFASILKPDKRGLPAIPEDITILSWNYDYQIELALMEYLPHLKNSPAAYLLKDLHLYIRGYKESGVNDGFSIFKINGATAFISEHRLHYYRDMNPGMTSMLENIVQNYCFARFTPKIFSTSFAWEEDGQDDMFDSIFSRCGDTDILVVIGYSFPFFNRDVDKRLLMSMSDLSTIYVQDINPAPTIERIKAIKATYHNTYDVKPIHGVDQFYLPHEM